MSAKSLVTNEYMESVANAIRTDFLNNGEIWPVILERINKAQSEICIAFPWITYGPIVETLVKVKQRSPHLKIKVITSNRNLAIGGGNDSGHAENIKKLDDYGIQVHTVFKPFVHCKSISIDRKVLIVGSMNASYSAANLNVEHAIITEEKHVIEKFQKEFDQLWCAALFWGAKIGREMS